MLKYVTCLFLVIGMPAAAKTQVCGSTISVSVSYHAVNSIHGKEAAAF